LAEESSQQSGICILHLRGGEFCTKAQYTESPIYVQIVKVVNVQYYAQLKLCIDRKIREREEKKYFGFSIFMT